MPTKRLWLKISQPNVQSNLMPHRRGRGDGTASTNKVESVNRVQTLGRKKHNANKGTVSSGNAFNSKKSCYRCGGNHQEKNANSPMKGVTGVTRPDTLLGCAEQYRNLCSTVWHM